jgi:hypothetical protein
VANAHDLALEPIGQIIAGGSGPLIEIS